MNAPLAAELVNALRCAAAAVPDYSATFIEAADEIERLRRELAAHTIAVLSVQHERDCAVKGGMLVAEKNKRQRRELRRLNKTLRSMWEGIRFSVKHSPDTRSVTTKGE